ncbi:hypothetical protein PA25_20150 [Pseudoalteromonas sp. A25]|uniref:hypothetical protein n=1 Tax=Pseudoalteromonas sp. A25 TaxID=116092 RepID=UPI0012A32DCD|nr:hypothetical protein [Pseudoalteromonas sp. A25]BBN82030.1 hypothetical protein PA25_20150 [Pseudoalteromonas sp. A25]
MPESETLLGGAFGLTNLPFGVGRYKVRSAAIRLEIMLLLRNNPTDYVKLLAKSDYWT